LVKPLAVSCHENAGLLALATLGDTTQTEMILIAKTSKAGIFMALKMYESLYQQYHLSAIYTSIKKCIVTLHYIQIFLTFFVLIYKVVVAFVNVTLNGIMPPYCYFCVVRIRQTKRLLAKPGSFMP
jgi:hypothetical protein